MAPKKSVLTLALIAGIIGNVHAMQNPTQKLFNAIARHDLQQVQEAIKQGANILTATVGGQTALQFATQYATKDIVETLLTKGAITAINQGGFIGMTPLMLANISSPDLSPDDKIEKIQLLLDSGANIDVADHNGKTPLHWATNSLAATNLLLHNGAAIHINTPDNSGKTPLHEAIIKNNPDVIKLLFDQGAASTLDNVGRTLLHYAAQHTTPQVVQFLLDHGEAPHLALQDAYEMTPLDHAIHQRNIPVINYFLLKLDTPDLWQQFEQQHPAAIEKIRKIYRDLAEQWNQAFMQARTIPLAPSFRKGQKIARTPIKIAINIADYRVPEFNKIVARRLGFRRGKPAQTPQTASSTSQSG